MKFRFVGDVEGRVKTYQGQTVAYGEEVEFTGPFVDKAKRNPNYEAVVRESGPVKKVSKKQASKKKVTHG